MPFYKLISLPICLLGLGCAQITNVPPGTPFAAVEEEFGTPSTLCQTNSESNRAIWSQQPMGQFAWATTIDSQGRVGEFEQVLTDQSFERLGEGVWTPERVQCAFGPPENITKVGLPSDLKIVWSYRYRQYGVWYSLMYVFFGTDGKQVTQFYAGPDPMFDRDRPLFWLSAVVR